MRCSSSIGRPLGSETPDALADYVQVSGVSDYNTGCVEHEQGNEKKPALGPNLPKDFPSPSSPWSATHMDENGGKSKGEGFGLGLGQPEDIASPSGCATHTDKEEETNQEKPGPDQIQSLPSPSGYLDINEEGPGSRAEQPQDLPSSLVSALHLDTNKEIKFEEEPRPGVGKIVNLYPSPGSSMTDQDKEVVITNIRATDIALGLARIPAGFYTVVHHTGLEWRTENKRSTVNDDIVEWDGPIPIPSDLSAIISLGIFASFEFQPMLGSGEQLRNLTFTVEQLLDRSARDIPFTLLPKGRDVVSPCSSISITVRRRKRESSDSSASTVVGPRCSTTESRSDLEEATNEGHSALLRYRKHGEKQDLECSIKQFEHALDICPLDHPCRAAVQSNLAMAKFIFCQVEPTNASFDFPVTLYRDALAARPIGNVDRPSMLIQLAAVHLARSEKRGDEVDGALAEGLLNEAMELSSTASHENRAAIFMLQLCAKRKTGPVRVDRQPFLEQRSTSRFTDEDQWNLSVHLLQRFERFGDLADVQHAISLLEELVRSTSTSDYRYPARLSHLSVALLYRFDDLGELSDLEDGISRQRDAVDLTPHGHPNKPTYLGNLGTALRGRFERTGVLSDLEEAISMHRHALDLTPHGHPDAPARLNNLGTSLFTHFKCVGKQSDLEEAISRQRDAIYLIPHGHPSKPDCLKNLGDSFLVRFGHLGEPSDLEEAISSHSFSVDLTPYDYPDKPVRLNSLGNSLLTRFNRFGGLNDLEEAISRQKDAVDLTPHGRFDKSNYLNSLGGALLTRFKRLGESSDLEKSISNHRDAVNSTPHGHHHKPAYLNNLVSSFGARFKRFGHLSDLEEAISRQRDAVDLTPHGHPDKPTYLNNLGSVFRARFNRIGELSDLKEAISRYRDAVDLTPHGHPDKPARLNNLGISLHTHFQRFGESSDLEEAISRCREAFDLTPHGHPDKPAHSSGLGLCFLARFERRGELSDLEEAILRHSDAVDLTPHDDPDKSSRLNNLGLSLWTRFDRLGDLSDLEEAILRQRDAVDLTPHGHPDKPTRLSNLGISFQARFEHLATPNDIEAAIAEHKDAVDFTPYGHPDRPSRLTNLSNSFFIRFKHFGKLSDLEEAISRQRDAVEAIPHGHPRKPGCLSNLGTFFRARFKHLGELSDLDEAILGHRDAVNLTPDDHPSKPTFLIHLGQSFFSRFLHLREPNSLEQAISLYSRAASASTGPINVRFRAAQDWISCACGARHHTLLHAYSVAVGLLPQLAWIGLSLTHRYHDLVQGADVVRDAAAAALDSGLPEVAVEWLEQGRSIVWGELFELRSSYEELSSGYPDHASRLRELSITLEHAGATHEKSLSSLSEQTESIAMRPHSTESLRQEADRHRALAIERDQLLQEIRGFPGFERFLLHKEFSRLRASAHSGSVVILNAAESRCDALIVLADVDRVIHVPLADFTFQRSAGFQKMLKRLLGHARIIRCDDSEREGKRATRDDVRWESVLSSLWKCVVKPVLDALAFSTLGEPSRIFWCPAGPFMFLPIHAAGLYDTQNSQPGYKAFDFVVSSYVPTLTVLSRTSNSDAAPDGDLRLLAVRQPSSDGLPQLPGVDAELRHIRTVIGSSPSARITLVESSDGTVEEVLGLMKEADWVHFACHGIQDVASPTESGLCLADGHRLKISDIIALSRPRGGLAFLSACQTAMGDEGLSDEAIHIAAGMLFAGYGGVIGTMWSISDKLAPHVARDVYGQLILSGTRPDYREAAGALHEAIGRLRESNASFAEWLPFIHVGL